jgi:hypothetical protein
VENWNYPLMSNLLSRDTSTNLTRLSLWTNEDSRILILNVANRIQCGHLMLTISFLLSFQCFISPWGIALSSPHFSPGCPAAWWEMRFREAGTVDRVERKHGTLTVNKAASGVFKKLMRDGAIRSSGCKSDLQCKNIQQYIFIPIFQA